MLGQTADEMAADGFALPRLVEAVAQLVSSKRSRICLQIITTENFLPFFADWPSTKLWPIKFLSHLLLRFKSNLEIRLLFFEFTSEGLK